MTEQDVNPQQNHKIAMIIKLYPFGLLLISVIANLVFGVRPMTIALPASGSVFVLVVTVVMLIINHTWLMTATELTRLRYDLHATPEEWWAKGLDPKGASPLGVQELQRHHNAHRNMTENTLFFALLAPLFLLTSPAMLVVQVWLIGFALGRLGHTFGYLSGNDGLRGVFMSISLLGLYGIASYLMMAMFW